MPLAGADDDAMGDESFVILEDRLFCAVAFESLEAGELTAPEPRLRRTIVPDDMGADELASTGPPLRRRLDGPAKFSTS